MKAKRVWDVALVVECKHEALSSIPSTRKEKKGNPGHKKEL
jgi:hypothetical protein